MSKLKDPLTYLQEQLEGEIRDDIITKTLYSTDASMYREIPLAVTWPKNKEDLLKIIKYAVDSGTGLIIRGAGTSLAGQVVGSGLIVDISKHMTRVLELNVEEKWVRVEPGVILEELNMELIKHGIFFGPETSTANRCTMGGMLGNNACGLHSLRYGSTREHTIEVKTILSDGSEVEFGELSDEEFRQKCDLQSLEGNIYRKFAEILDSKENAKIIEQEYPDPSIPRRNTGYALDLLLNTSPFREGSTNRLNLAKLIAGSEGTLVFVTEMKLKLVELPPPVKVLCCIHLKERDQAYKANLVALKYKPDAVEMMDDKVLELTKDNIEQRKNRFFVEGNPGALLIVEFTKNTKDETEKVCKDLISSLKKEGFGYAYPIVYGTDISKVWALRKAGLGVLSNLKGDAKPVSLIEDTAVGVENLHEYIVEFNKIIDKYKKECVYHAHIGTGELHLRPLLNMKDKAEVELFHTLGEETAKLVKKFRGSLSGEHGDGRLRGEFIPIMLGEHIYSLLKEVKTAFDPSNIMNPGKIVDTPPMDKFLRYEPGNETPVPETIFSFDNVGGIIRAAEKCNGSGDCRKSDIIGGTMCPSYMATRDEQNTTRARANVLREFLSKPGDNIWDHREIYEVLDLCLSCKGCKSECPSSVDIAKLKSEFMQHWYDKHGIPLRSRLIAYITSINKLGSIVPGLFNFFTTNAFLSGIIKKMLGFAKKRSIPTLYKITLQRWARRNLTKCTPAEPLKKVYLFADEFTNYNDTLIGIEAIELLTSLNYEVIIPKHSLSGRTFLSKGLVRTAAKHARKNIAMLSTLVSEDSPLIGLEPSAILGFRDEYPDIVDNKHVDEAKKLASNVFMIDEFIASEFKKGNISKELFRKDNKEILLHGHCQQKAIADTGATLTMLTIPENYSISEIPSGCCGMAGSFGYEKEHYDLSLKVGELVLLPAVRAASEETVIVAPGTSCRHQIKDGTGRKVYHPVQILRRALLSYQG